MCLGATFNLSWATIIHQLLHNLPVYISTTSLPCSKASKDTPGCSEQKLKSQSLCWPLSASLTLCPILVPIAQSAPGPGLLGVPQHTKLVPVPGLCTNDSFYRRLFPRLDHGLLSLHSISGSHLFGEVPWTPLCAKKVHSSLLSVYLALLFSRHVFIWLVCLLIVCHYH